jgi:TonB family protein
MSKRTNLTLLFVLVLCSSVAASARIRLSPSAFYLRFGHTLPTASDREQDGLAGPVRRVKTETAKISVKNGKPVEGARVVLETTTYDQRGTRIDNAYFLAAGGTLTGKEVYKYDDKGNMVEMTLYNDDGSLLAKEVYTYEFDAVGNWVKMTTAVAIIEAGKINFEPSEVTYRTISYFLDESMMAKMSQPASQPAAQPKAQPVAAPAQSSPAPANSNALMSQNAQANAAASQPVSKPVNVASVPASKPASNPVSKPASNPTSQPVSKPAEQAKAAPVVLASLEKASLPNPSLPASSVAAASSESGPAVKSDGEAPAARPVVRGPLKPVSGGILNGKAISLPSPLYPEVAKRMHTTGLVEVEVVIDLSGKVISAKAVKGPVLLLQAAEQAAKQAKFTPTLLSGQPVKISGIITYNFTLQ